MKITDSQDADRSNHRVVRPPRSPRVKQGGRLREHGDGSGAQLAACYSRALSIRGKLREPRAASRSAWILYPRPSCMAISVPHEVQREWRREELALLQRMARPGE